MSKKVVVLSVIGGIIIGGAASLISAQMVENTGKPEFCASCHEMKPMYETWLKGPHGPLGNKRGAVRAVCVDCHLPHDNVVSYLIAKGTSGMRDFIAHAFKGGYMDNPSHWLEKLNEPEKYTYIESCKHCHTVLPKNKSHLAMEKGKVSDNCLNCHWYVGHGEVLSLKVKKFFGR